MNNKTSNAHLLTALPTLLVGLGAALLAMHPLLWLMRTWFDPAYNSSGLWAAVVALTLAVWSFTSPLRKDSRNPLSSHRTALVLLLITSVVRALGQAFAINIVAAASLVIDVYALGLLARLSFRSRAISPGWLALVFFFALPLERVLQRCVGYGLQHLSAHGAGGLLHCFVDDVVVQGVRIAIHGQNVLVDLPCSGARGLLNLVLLYVVLMTIRRPSIFAGISGFLVTLFGALLANILRIALLSTGLAFPDLFFNINVMASPWHDVLGLLCLLFGSLPIFIWATHVRAVSNIPHQQLHWRLPAPLRTVFAAIFVLCAICILFIPQHPADVSQECSPLSPPIFLEGVPGQHLALLPQEQTYFQQYGGGASKVQYGPYSVTLVQTTAPLRHLHNPTECLRGLGYEVTPMDTILSPIPTALYKATDTSGAQWRVAVTFVSNTIQATTVSEAVWHWLRGKAPRWLAIQRLSPWSINDAEALFWDRALCTALDIPLHMPQQSQATQLHL